MERERLPLIKRVKLFRKKASNFLEKHERRDTRLELAGKATRATQDQAEKVALSSVSYVNNAAGSQ